jgi:peptidase M28-like protein
LNSESLPGIRRILFALAVLAVIFFFSLNGARPPASKPVDAPETQFSGARAREVLNRLVGDGVPHPVGSAADDVVRGRVIAEFTKIGYQPEVQPGFACDEYGTCASVKNVLARLDGSEAPSSGSVLLASHYDSVPAGPGASDDGMGTAAVLEIARALKSLPQPRHSVIFLIDEGEEAGLLGARVFVDQHPWAKEIRAVVNIDNRGTSGSSLMFETGSANRAMVQLYAKHAAHPASSSIFYTAYKQLPNDTDFTIFKAAGYQGLNFAIIGDVAHYHTPLDNFANASPDSLQHHGDNALPSVIALSNSDLTSLPPGEAVYFDVFQRFLISWPVNWTLSIAAIAALLLIFQIVWLARNGRLEPPEIAWGLLSWLATILVTGGAAFLVRWLLRAAGTLPVEWVAHPLPLEIAFWSLGFAVVVLLASAFGTRARFWGLWAGVWIWWTLLAVVVAWQIPGFSYVFVVPACAAAVAGLPFTLRRNHAGNDERNDAKAGTALVVIVPLAVAGIVLFAPMLSLYDALGNSILLGTALLSALVFTPMGPLIPDLRSARGFWKVVFVGATVGVAALAIFAAVVAPAYSAKSPERVNLEYWKDADTGKSQWIVRPRSARLPSPIGVAAKFSRAPKDLFPWTTAPAFLADSPHLDFPAPTFTILESQQEGDKRSYRALLRSERGAPIGIVLFPPESGIDSVRIEGTPLGPESPRIRGYLNGWTIYECVTLPPRGVELSFTLPPGKPFEIYVIDESFGLPLEGMFLRKSRPLTATQSQNGDVTDVSRRIQLIP